MKNYEIKQAFKNLPDAGRPDNETVACMNIGSVKGVIIRHMVSSVGMATVNA